MRAIEDAALRVMVADDSAVMRGIMRTLFATHAEHKDSELPTMEICAEASDGLECLETVRRTQPDVLLLDLEMPRMNGLGVLDQLQAESPDLPVIMCSAYTELGARLTVDALARGASDYVMKPGIQNDFAQTLRLLSEQLLPKIIALAARRRGKRNDEYGEMSLRASQRGKGRGRCGEPFPVRTEIILIGASTGGPMALEMMLPMLPADLPVPVLIVQHMPKLFTGALAERLDRCCALRVREAYEGAITEPGTVWLAPGDLHMEIGRTGAESVQIRLHQKLPVNYCRPSVDLLFKSAAVIYGPGTLAVVLTGMGTDGLAGARQVHEAGGTVLAQDQESSAVWGMPGRVTQAGIACATLPLMSLGEELTRRAWRRRRHREELCTRQGFVTAVDDGMIQELGVADRLF
jgi:two-component system chemotaxis response regulator CheB